MNNSTRYLEDAQKLKVNQTKSQIGSPKALKFLGFSLWKIGEKSGVRIHEKSVIRFKDKVRSMTRRNRGVFTRSNYLLSDEISQGVDRLFRFSEPKDKSPGMGRVDT
jgi:hypothetical protein